MKRFQKLSAVVLAGVLVFGAAGCKNDGAAATQAPTVKPTEAPVTATETPLKDDDGGTPVGGGAEDNNAGNGELDAPVEPEANPSDAIFWENFETKDLGGRTIRFVANWDWMGTAIMADKPTEDVDNYEQAMMRYETARRVESRYNVKFESISIDFDSISESLQTSVMSGDPFAEFVALQDNNLISVLANEFAMPITDYMTDKSDAMTSQLVCVPGQDLLGGVFFFKDKPRWGGAYYFNTAMMGVNQNIIASVGAKNPVELYDKGEWTWDAFLEIARLANKDLDGDGVIDQYGFVGNYGWPTMAFISSNGVPVFDAGSWKVNIDHPASVRALNFIEQITITEGLWSFEGGIFEWGIQTNAFKDGKAVFFYVEPYMTQGFIKEGATFEFNVLPFPIGPDNTEGHSLFAIKPAGNVMPRGVKDAQFVYQIYEELMDWFGDDMSYVTDESNMGDLINSFQSYEDFIRICEYTDEGGIIDLAWPIVGTKGLDTVFGSITDGSQTVAQAIEANLQAMQEAADKYLAKRK